MSVSEAAAALERLASLGRAMQDAQKVVDALRNAEQVERETKAAIEAARADLAKLQSDIRDAEGTLESVRLKLNDATAKAARDARALMDAAQARVQECENEIALKRSEADVQLAASQELLNRVAQDKKAAEAELAAVEDKISAAKKRWADMQNVMGGAS